MSKRTKSLLVLSAILVAAIIAYLFLTKEKKQKNIQMYAVPKNAAAVVEIDLPKLLDKADPTTLLTHSGFSNNKLFSAAFNAVTSGIDPDEIIYGFAVKEQMDDFLGIVIRLTDAGQFASFVKDAGIKATPEDKGDFKFIAAGMNYGIGYTDDVAVILYSQSENIAEYAGKYLQLDAESSIEREPGFAEFHSKKHDIGMFTDNKELAELNDKTNVLSMVGMDSGHGELSCTFFKDQIHFEYESFPAIHILYACKDEGISIPFFSSIAPTNPLLFASAHFDTNKLMRLLQSDSATAGSIKEFQSSVGLDSTSFQKLFTGEVAFAVSDYRELSGYDPRLKKMISDQIPKNSYCVDVMVPIMYVPMCYISIGITDRNKMESMLQQLGLKKTNGFYMFPGLDFIVYAACNDDRLMITNDYYAADSIAKNKLLNGMLPFVVTHNSNTNPFFSWVDLDTTHYPDEMLDTAGYVYKENSLARFYSLASPFQSAGFAAGLYHPTTFSLFLKPGDGNSLNRLLLYYADLK